MVAAFLTAEDLRDLLEDLARRLHARGVTGTILVVGGAAMSLGHDRQRVTRDIDGDFHPRQIMQAVAAEVARERGLRENWLSDGAASILPHLEPEDRVVLWSFPGLNVQLASPRVLLAMKMAAFRATDMAELESLFKELGVVTPDQAVRITREMYGENAVVIRDDEDDDLRLQAEEILERMQSNSRMD